MNESMRFQSHELGEIRPKPEMWEDAGHDLVNNIKTKKYRESLEDISKLSNEITSDNNRAKIDNFLNHAEMNCLNTYDKEKRSDDFLKLNNEIYELRSKIRDINNKKICENSEGIGSNLWKLLKNEYPDFSKMLKINRIDADDPAIMELTTGYFAIPEKPIKQLEVNVVFNDAQHYENIISKRQDSIQRIANQLHVESNAVTPQILNIFTLLHEIGHAYEFANRFYLEKQLFSDKLSKDKYGYTKRKDLYLLSSILHIALEKTDMPIPIFNPAGLEDMITSGKIIDNLKNPLFRTNLKRYGIDEQDIISNPQKVIDLQKKKYKDLPSEKYADNFAISFLQKHSKEIGINI